MRVGQFSCSAIVLLHLLIGSHEILQVGDVAALGISESFKVKQAILLSATEAAEALLRVDEIIRCAPRRREDRM